jgi:DDE superfamily endonuclease
MTILTYESVKHKADTLKAMTSLNRLEFEELLIPFAKAWDELTQPPQKNPSKGGRPPILTNAADRLLFILFYLKTYPLQEVIAHVFGLSQGQANFLIHQLSAVLQKSFKEMGVLPTRIPDDMVARLQNEAAQDFGIDGTECRINRPTDPVGQENHYSGKKKPTR